MYTLICFIGDSNIGPRNVNKISTVSILIIRNLYSSFAINKKWILSFFNCKFFNISSCIQVCGIICAAVINADCSKRISFLTIKLFSIIDFFISYSTKNRSFPIVIKFTKLFSILSSSEEVWIKNKLTIGLQW